MEQQRLMELKQRARQIRRDVIDMTLHAGSEGGHLGGSLSLTEILTVLYFDIMQLIPSDPLAVTRDRLILSKGHGAMTMYAALAQLGYFSREELMTYKKDHSLVSAHPTHTPERGMEFASGSLGQGLALGVGTCIGLRLKKNDARVYVVMGDGEIDEGSVWEAAAAAAHYGLNRLTAIIDANQLQYDGPTNDVFSMGDLVAKWQAFGWEAERVDGHDLAALSNALHGVHERPFCLICDTVKGKGVSFAENNYRWHNAVMTCEQHKQALEELEDKP